MAALASSSPVPDADGNTLVKRDAWSVYLFSGQDCNFATNQGGYSSFGSQPCTNIASNSVEADTQGCNVIVYQSPGCDGPVHTFPQGDTCFSVISPFGGALQSFSVSC